MGILSSLACMMHIVGMQQFATIQVIRLWLGIVLQRLGLEIRIEVWLCFNLGLGCDLF